MSHDVPLRPASARSVDELRALVDTGATPKYLHFWGHQPQADGTVGPSCLSQWFETPFTVDGVHYRTAEHWMMAQKARLFGDPEAERAAVDAPNPALAKAAGRTVREFDDAVWVRERFEIVVRGNEHKFASRPELREYLLRTGSRVLVEASPRDRVWGIGMGARNESAEDPAGWRGLNLLGFALMEARERLRG
ncbi:NADAR family protein [Promicromonospora kroppenstedtii]|uniref:NADAR family protein n=1 Tax=Promicromonospora kroppenstedtii TaxID=440482 RepID=UPI0004B16DEA|nr:NADAR family protein [Promicromonospora kroppenstedtii]